MPVSTVITGFVPGCPRLSHPDSNCVVFRQDGRLERQPGLKSYETVFQILRKSRGAATAGPQIWMRWAASHTEPQRYFERGGEFARLAKFHFSFRFSTDHGGGNVEVI